MCTTRGETSYMGKRLAKEMVSGMKRLCKMAICFADLKDCVCLNGWKLGCNNFSRQRLGLRIVTGWQYDTVRDMGIAIRSTNLLGLN